jgi:hypothetical protein
MGIRENINIILRKNRERLDKYFYDYDPVVGDIRCTAIERKRVKISGHTFYLPVEMLKKENTIMNNINKFPKTAKTMFEFCRLRLKYDFEFYCATCVDIKHKQTGVNVKFILNYGQRKLLHDLEDMRIKGMTIEDILVKSRQFGGSTLITNYILWIQLFHKKGWDSFVVALDMGQANNIREMTEMTIRNFPAEIMKVSLKNFGLMKNTKIIHERNCRIAVGSNGEPDALRSYSGFAMHLSEVGLWKSDGKQSADALAQSLWAIVPRVPMAIRVLESTAKGTGNFFHKEVQAALKRGSGRRVTFVSWYEIPMYACIETEDRDGDIIIKREKNGLPVSKIKDYNRFISEMTDYQWWQWEQGATLEGIMWYAEEKQTKNYSDFQIKSEFPTTLLEAFQSYENNVFEPEYRVRARNTCKDPVFTGEIYADGTTGKSAFNNVHLVENGNGSFNIWKKPEEEDMLKSFNRYLVVVDIGGLSPKSDWSVISVFDRQMVADPFGALEHVATWRGHIDHDLLAWKAMQIAYLYDEALLVIEVNTIDSRDKKTERTSEGNHTYTVIDEIAEVYSNVYTRPSSSMDNVNIGKTFKYGFHTNKHTKYAAYDRAKVAFREYRYIERDVRVADEMETLVYADGRIESSSGNHDDIIDTVAIGIYVSEDMNNPYSVPVDRIKLASKMANIDIVTGLVM